MKALIASLLLISTFSLRAFAGASNVELKCKSADGKTVLDGDIPGDFVDFDLKATVQTKNGPLEVHTYWTYDSTSNKVDSNGWIGVIDGAENGVYTIKSQGTDGVGEIALYALPKTLKVRALNGSGFTYTFTGKLSVIKAMNSSFTQVTCTASSSI